MGAGKRYKIPRSIGYVSLSHTTRIKVMQRLEASINKLMKRRRGHSEYMSRAGERESVVLGTPVCTFAKREQPPSQATTKWVRKFAAINAAFWVILVTLVVEDLRLGLA
jgi:hypothetical protein